MNENCHLKTVKLKEKSSKSLNMELKILTSLKIIYFKDSWKQLKDCSVFHENLLVLTISKVHLEIILKL